MSDKPDTEGAAPRLRGDAAWRAQKEQVAARNAQARKAGREQRQASEQNAAAQRRAADRREMAELVDRPADR